MPKGLQQDKRRYASRRTNRARQIGIAAAYAASQTEIKKLFRSDLKTGETTEINRSKMEREIDWYDTFARWNCLAGPSSVAWEEISNGAILFTHDAMFWIEKVPVEATPKASLEPGEVKQPCGCVFNWNDKFTSRYCDEHQREANEVDEEYRWAIYQDSAA